jgi:hypothetical protein
LRHRALAFQHSTRCAANAASWISCVSTCSDLSSWKSARPRSANFRRCGFEGIWLK